MLCEFRKIFKNTIFLEQQFLAITSKLYKCWFSYYFKNLYKYWNTRGGGVIPHVYVCTYTISFMVLTSCLSYGVLYHLYKFMLVSFV